jgi:hypothetical protein
MLVDSCGGFPADCCNEVPQILMYVGNMRWEFLRGRVLGLIATLAHLDAMALIEVRGIVARGVQKFMRPTHWQFEFMNSNTLIRGEKGVV